MTDRNKAAKSGSSLPPCSEIVRIPVRLGYGDNWIGTLQIKVETAREIAAMSLGLKSAPQVSLVIEADTNMIREIALGWAGNPARTNQQ